MPASYTHAYFGLEVLKQLDGDIKNIILNNKKYYMMGLYGPDPVFFYKAYKRNPINDYGDSIHSKEAYDFFNNARSIIKDIDEKDRYIAYICGFMNHFILDSEVHSYIFKSEHVYNVSHARIESQFDRAVILKQGIKPSRLNHSQYIYKDKDIAIVMSKFFNLDIKTMHTAISHMKLFNSIFHCPNKVKLKLVMSLLDKLKLSSISDMIILDEQDTRCIETSKVLVEKLENSIPIAVEHIYNYYEQLSNNNPLSKRLHRNYN